MKIEVDKGLFSKDVVLKTAYSFTDKAYLHLAQTEQTWVIEWTVKEDQNIDSREFENELISQQLRERLIQQTDETRKILLARAFASSMIYNPTQEDRAIYWENTKEEGMSEESAESIMKGWFER